MCYTNMVARGAMVASLSVLDSSGRDLFSSPAAAGFLALFFDSTSKK